MVQLIYGSVRRGLTMVKRVSHVIGREVGGLVLSEVYGPVKPETPDIGARRRERTSREENYLGLHNLWCAS